MLEVVVGGFLPRDADYILTFCPSDRYTGIGVPLEPEASLLIYALSMRMNQPLFIEHTKQLKECASPICLLFQFADVADVQIEKGVATYKAPQVDPASLITAFALAFALERRLGGGWLLELYSDVWHEHIDLLLYLKPLKGVVRIYTSTLSEKAHVADRVVLNHAFKPEALSLREYRGYPWCMPYASPPEEEDEAVKELVRTAVESGGFISLKYALETFGQDAVAKAVSRGLLRYDSVTMSLRVTEYGLSV
ncbi:MAG: hypothetical protein QXP31_05215 [Pyrobaculum sp.]|uniref:hypothetical protein n=1 Tax=Pyrobaculum sp. TaxID=2004705 RepID=UPI0031675CEE